MAGQASVIDELVVSLALDPTKFNAAQKQSMNTLRQFQRQAQETATRVESDTQKMIDAFSRLTKEILGFGLTLAGANGLKDLVIGTVQSTDALGKRTRALEMDTEAMSKWANASRIAGMSAAEAQGDIASMLVTLGRIANRQQFFSQAGLQELIALGVNPTAELASDPEKYQRAVVAAIQRHKGELTPGRLQAISEAVPGGQHLLALALQNKTMADLEYTLNRSVTVNQQEVDAARNLTSAVTSLQISIERQTSKLSPILDKIFTPAAAGWEKLLTQGFPPVAHEDEGFLNTLVRMFIREDRQHELLTEPEPPVTGTVPGGKDTGRSEGLLSWTELRNALVRTFIREDRQGELMGELPAGPSPFVPEPNARPRVMPYEGERKIQDRFMHMMLPNRGAGSSATTNNNQKSVTVGSVVVNTPPGTKNPEGFGATVAGTIENYFLVQAESGAR